MADLGKFKSMGSTAKRFASALVCHAAALGLLAPSAALATSRPAEFLKSAQAEIVALKGKAECTSSPSCVAAVGALEKTHLRVVKIEADGANHLKVEGRKDGEPLSEVQGRYRRAGAEASSVGDQMKDVVKGAVLEIRKLPSDPNFKKLFDESNEKSEFSQILNRYRQAIESQYDLAKYTAKMADGLGDHREKMTSLGGGDKDGGGSGAAGAGWTALGIGAGALVAAGATYFVGKELIKEAGSEADKVVDRNLAKVDETVDRNLDKIEARTKQIIEDAKKSANDFIKTQIDRIKEEVKDLSKEAIQELRNEIMEIYDDLIAKAKADGDVVLAAKLEKAKVDIGKYFEDLLKQSVEDAVKEKVGDFGAGDDSDVIGTDPRLAGLPAQLNVYKSAGKTGDALVSACRASGADMLGKSVGGLTSGELGQINAICLQ